MLRRSGIAFYGRVMQPIARPSLAHIRVVGKLLRHRNAPVILHFSFFDSDPSRAGPLATILRRFIQFSRALFFVAERSAGRPILALLAHRRSCVKFGSCRSFARIHEHRYKRVVTYRRRCDSTIELSPSVTSGTKSLRVVISNRYLKTCE